jgi:hypothetical protein
MRDVALPMGKKNLITFGKYKGRDVRDVPSEWLEWWFYAKDFKQIPKFIVDEVFRRKLNVSELIAGDPEFVKKPRF